jgi:hypothetical protein
VVALNGPFGRYDGFAIEANAPLPEPSSVRPLDSYGRGASLSAAARDERLWLESWRFTAVAEPVMEVDSVTELGAVDDSPMDQAIVTAPPTGVWLIRLDATLVRATDPAAGPVANGSWIWRLVVPDREFPDPEVRVPPAPTLMLASGPRALAMDPGSGCYVGTCGDIGAPPPDDRLEPLQVSPGAPLVMSLDDRSGLAAWDIRVRPVGGTDEDWIQLARDWQEVSRPFAVFAAPPSGNWFLEASFQYDLERGGATAYARLVVP